MTNQLGKRSAVLVDRHMLLLEALDQLVRGIGIDVVGKFTTAASALASLDDIHVDVDLLVTEIDAPSGELDGLALIRRVRERFPESRSIALANSDEPTSMEAAFGAGVAAYVLKTTHPDDLLTAIRQAFLHSVFFANSATWTSNGAVIDDEQVPVLTRREREILRLVAEGHSNSELARMLWVTEQTVKFHLSNIYRKLNVSNRTEASRWAQLHGLLSAATGT
jgi:NarL family two-component system response regulator LiaR